MTSHTLIHYFDYKSPYAYLAQEAVFELADSGVNVEVLPYTLYIPDYLGSAEVDEQGNVLSEQRNAHQWRRIKYSYMDCRREANRRGLTLRGPRKIFDSSIAHIGMLYAKREGDFRAYHNIVFERFWKRELDIAEPSIIGNVLEECGFDGGGFAAYLRGEGRTEHDRLREQAEALGVFGVPSYWVDSELYWGAERLERARERLAAE